MTPKELAVLGLDYLTGKPSPLTPVDKDEVVTSSSLEGMEGITLKYFLEKLEDESINEYDEESNIGKVEASVTYDANYSFKNDEKDSFILLFNITDVYKAIYKRGGDGAYSELLHRNINSVIVEVEGEVVGIDMDTIKDLVFDYVPIHRRVYDAFKTNSWAFVFKWKSLSEYKEEQRAIWDNYQQSNKQPSATLPPFARFQMTLKKQLEKYLEERKPISFITQFVEEQIDTAHLYGMNEKTQFKK